ncbi:MAG: IPT/TIG domain-containing protein [Bacteroidota bacterium]
MIIFPRITMAAVVAAACLLSFNSCKKSNFTPDDDQPDQEKTLPQIFDVSPLKGLPNTVIKIRGRDFDTNIGHNILYVGASKLEIISITDKEMIGVLPANAPTGAATISIYSGERPVDYDQKFSVLRGVQSDFFKPFANTVQFAAVADDGNAYGFNGSDIYKIQPNGSVLPITTVGNEFKSTAGFTFTMLSDMYVANRGNFNIVKITPQKVVSVLAGSGVQGYEDGPATTAKFMGPSGIAYYLGYFYVIDGRRVRKISSSGLVTTLAGSGADGNVDGVGTNAQFGTLEGITVDADGTVYVTDSKYLNIRKITADGKVITLAGSGSTGFKDGIASIAQFTKPRAIAIDASGNLFVSDENSALPYYAIRMVNQLGDVSTLIKGTTNAPVQNGVLSLATTYSPLGLSVVFGL